MKTEFLKKISQLIRYDILTSTTKAGSGHPTTCLSAVELMTTLFFGGFFHQDLKDPKAPSNDRLIFSKGHAAPLLYSLYHLAGVLTYEELMTLRDFYSVLEGHPTPRFKYVDVATGSLGQGLSVGVGMALGIKLKMKNEKLRVKREPRVWVLLGDSEMAEGQVWEAMEIAGYYKLDNLVAIIDVNRLGQSRETMLDWDLQTYAKRAQAFGWETIIIKDGHNLVEISRSLSKLVKTSGKPKMLLAKTIKGKGVSFLENKDGWHGKPVPKEMLGAALKELGEVDFKIRGKINKPNVKCQMSNVKSISNFKFKISNYQLGQLVATREAYGDALVAIGEKNKQTVVLDAEVSNSTYSGKFKKVFPNRYFEMFIAEQNMVSAALGISKLGFVPFLSSFAAFLSRGFDQLRLAQYSQPNLKVVGSHAGVSIGADGPSQMGLEDLAMMRSLVNSIVFYPSDAVSTFKLTAIMAKTKGMFYLRTTREKTPVIYEKKEEFKIGGCKIHYVKNDKLQITNDKSISNNKFKKLRQKILIIAVGITVHEALKAQQELAKDGIEAVVIDAYSVKPLDETTIINYSKQIRSIIVVEDHYPAGGLGEAVSLLITNNQIPITKLIHLCVSKIPRSGTPEELLRYEKIDCQAIVKAAKSITS